MSLELGGKSPNIVFPDADMEQAVPTSMFGVFFNSGQVCCAGTRIFVQRDITIVVDQLTTFSKNIKAGDPLDPKTTIGPVVSRSSSIGSRVTSMSARRKARKAALGGEIGKGKGYFVDPTVFSGVKNDMQIAREEIFGPVATAIPFKDENDAVLQGNDTEYGLAAAVWTHDISRAHQGRTHAQGRHRMGQLLQQLDPISPFGGYKQSGFGRELGKHALELYSQIKSVYVKL